MEEREKREEKTDDYSGHYVIASSWPPDRLPLERRTLVPIQWSTVHLICLAYVASDPSNDHEGVPGGEQVKPKALEQYKPLVASGQLGKTRLSFCFPLQRR